MNNPVSPCSLFFVVLVFLSQVQCALMVNEARRKAEEESMKRFAKRHGLQHQKSNHGSSSKSDLPAVLADTRCIRLGVLRMAPLERLSSYKSQHPVDVAAALTSHDQSSGIGLLSFSLPHNLPPDVYKVEVFRFGAQVAPMMSGSSSIGGSRGIGVGAGGLENDQEERDHSVKYVKDDSTALAAMENLTVQTGGRFQAGANS
jgi:hypothetical protein